MIIIRLKQAIRFIFGKYNSENNHLVNQYLSSEEFQVFTNMSEYEKIHSFNLLKDCLNHKLLKENMSYCKAALLHDCGKKNYSLFRRMKRVLIKDDEIECHPEQGYEKLKNLNLEVAQIVKNHHEDTTDPLMVAFQKLDDNN